MTTQTQATPTRSSRLSQLRIASGLQQRMQTRARIIDCAIPVFAARGPDAPTIDIFVKAAGISRGTFYNYFQTTRELFDAVFETLSNEVIAATVPVVADMHNPVVRFATGARVYYHWATADPAVAAFLSSASRVGTLAEERARHDLTQAMAAGLLEVTDLELALAVSAGVMVHALRTPGACDAGDARGSEVVRIILSGLGVAKPLVAEALAVRLPHVSAADARRG